MKRIVLYAMALVAFASCSHKKSGSSFEVQGKILHQTAGKVLLERLHFADPNVVVEDSATLDKDGSFELKTTSADEGLYRLVLENGVQLMLVNDNDEIQVEVNPSDLPHPIIKNSPASAELYSFVNDYSKLDSSISDISDKMKALQSSTTALTAVQDSSLKQYQNQQVTEVQSLNQHIADFVKNSSSPAAVSFALAQGSMSMAPDQIMNLAEDAKKRFSDNSTLMQFYSLLKQMPEQQEAVSNNGLIGKTAPDLKMKNPAGDYISISQFRGKYLLVDFWASWCGPCRAENPNVVAAYKQFKNKNFQILGISLDKDKSSWTKAIADDHLTWPQMSDLKYWDSESVQTYGFQGIPFNVLIDPSGKIIAVSLRGADLIQKLTQVLK